MWLAKSTQAPWSIGTRTFGIRVEVEWFKQVSPISAPSEGEIAVSGIGTIAAARVIPKDAPPFIAVSMYARWTSPHPSTNRTGWIYSDSSAHRIISDLSAFIASTDPGTHRVLAAGDLNMIYGAKDDNRLALPARDRTVTDRMAALGMEFLGPRFPAGVGHAPRPQGLRRDTENVPTYYTTRQSPSTAQNHSTTPSPRVVSTRDLRYAPSTPLRSGGRATTAACSSQSQENRRRNHCGGHAATRHHEESVTVEWRARRYILE